MYFLDPSIFEENENYGYCPVWTEATMAGYAIESILRDIARIAPKENEDLYYLIQM